MHSHYLSLSDSLLQLEPLQKHHIQSMRLLSLDSSIWTWYTSDLTQPDALEEWMVERLEESNKGIHFSYAIILKDSQTVIGSTSYGHFDWVEHCVEVGWTWLGKKYIGAGINKRVKFLMLRHAFETMNTERLEMRTDEHNARSRKAMEKIGAKYDGVLRNHRATQGGRRRNTVLYSIIRSEWEEIKNTVFKGF